MLNYKNTISHKKDWYNYCCQMKEKYPRIESCHVDGGPEYLNSYKVIDKFYGREYDTKGKKYDTVSTLGFTVDPNSDIAKQHGAAMGGEGEIASLRNALKNPSPLMMSDEKFDDMEFIVVQTPNMSQPRIYRYGELYVPI